MPRAWVLMLGLACVLAWDGPLRADDAAIIPAREAAKHIGETGIVRLTVKSSVDEKPRQLYFLDSEADYKDPANMAIVILYKDMAGFKKLGIDDPAKYYKGKTIRVRGRLRKIADGPDKGQIQVHVSTPTAIEVEPGA